jgi:NAD(P)-dependent dehydrogenase (short-subunit alcohol dehydrogenase family)
MATTTTAIVTGSGRGIGRETAMMLAKRGVNVVVCSRTQREIDETVNEIKKFHSGVIGVKCDVGMAADVDALVKKTVQEFGSSIDILVNNAAVIFLKRLADTTEKEWDETMNSNLKSAFLCCKAVLPYMKKNGAIINVSSGAGKVGYENLSAYCASKFGMMGLTASLAWETTVRVMAICPGDVDTVMQHVDPEYHRANKAAMLTAGQVAAKIVEMIYDADNNYASGQSVDI